MCSSGSSTGCLNRPIATISCSRAECCSQPSRNAVPPATSLLAQQITNDTDVVAAAIRDILAIDVDDGVIFEPERLTARVIREQDLYAGVRIAYVHRARQPLRVDVNVGHPVTPSPVELDYPPLLADPFPVLAYPIETLLAEKIVTMVDRGDTTTRERDFADIILLARRHSIAAAPLRAAVSATGRYRRSELRPLTEVLRTLTSSRQPNWERFVRHSGLQNQVPDRYAEAIADVTAFADPILTRAVTSGHWDPSSRTWQE